MENLAQHFPILQSLNFLNHAGVAPICGPAAQQLRHYAKQAESQAYFGSGWYAGVQRVKQLAAKLVHAPSEREIAFVANTSTGLSMVAGGLDWVAGDNVVITGVEYPANRYPWQHLHRLGVELIVVPQEPDGRIPEEEVAEAVNDRTRVVSVSHVQYSSGFRLDLRPISKMVHRAGGYLCVDAIQSVGALPVDVQEMGIDFLSADGHKWLLGPEGCGIFYCREDLIEMLQPPIVGWMCMVEANRYGDYRYEFETDARRFEPGSYNIAGILALGASIELLLDYGIENVWARIEALTQRLCEGLAGIGCRVISPRDPNERSGIVTFDPPDSAGSPGEIISKLATEKIVIVEREGHLRASPHFYNTVEQMDRLVEAIEAMVNRS